MSANRNVIRAAPSGPSLASNTNSSCGVQLSTTVSSSMTAGHSESTARIRLLPTTHCG